MQLDSKHVPDVCASASAHPNAFANASALAAASVASNLVCSTATITAALRCVPLAMRAPTPRSAALVNWTGVGS